MVFSKAIKRLLTLLFMSIAMTTLVLSLTASNILEITVIDVGQGESILIVTPENRTILIDAGQDYRFFSIYKTLKSKDINRIDILISTHPDYDHYGGLFDVLKYFEVGTVYVSGIETSDIYYMNFVSEVYNKGIKSILARAGNSYNFGSVTFTFVSPGVTLPTDDNDASVVMHLSYRNFSALFTADISSKRERHLLDHNALTPITVLKVSHHGSKDATSDAFLNVTKPKYALISVGEENKFGHPSDLVLSRLEKAGAEIFRTDYHGNITVWTDGDQVKITTTKDPPLSRSGEETIPSAGLPEPTLYVTNPSHKYVASIKSGVFHYPSCSAAQNIFISNLITFETRDEAIASGRRPCRLCNP